jgi:hypothetical protein
MLCAACFASAILTILVHYSSFIYTFITKGPAIEYLREYPNLILPIYPCNVVMWCALIFGIIRNKDSKIAKLDHDAAMEAFSAFINDESLNQKQIAFVHKIINYIEQNGYMESMADLQKPPFDKPVSFIKLFDSKTRVELIKTINSITDNAVNVVA